MARPNPLAKAEAALRKHALTYPGAVEEFPWGERAIKVKGKVFVFLSRGDHGLGISVKLPVSAASALGFGFAEPTGYGLGQHGWVTARFAKDDDVPTELLMEWIDESFRAVAPKRVVAELEAGEAEPAPKPRKKRSGPPR
jgi:predicted DNA-binding protein (MmcQ/YjbR family)